MPVGTSACRFHHKAASLSRPWFWSWSSHQVAVHDQSGNAQASRHAITNILLRAGLYGRMKMSDQG